MTHSDEGIELSISELAKLLHTSKSALRYYEKEGIIIPDRATSSGYRRYSFQSLIELSDVMLYRRLGVPVKEVRHLLDSPIEQTSRELDKAQEELLDQIREATRGLERIAARRKRINDLYATRIAGPALVDWPGVSSLFRFSVESVEAMHAYLGSPEKVRHAAYFPSATESEHYIDCTVQPCTDASVETVWSLSEDDASTRWLQCLMRTNYSKTGENNLAEHVAYLRNLGFGPGEVVAEYLTFDWDEPQHERVDYYRAWIAVHEPSPDA